MLIFRGQTPKPNTVVRDHACLKSKTLNGSARRVLPASTYQSEIES